MDRIPDMQIRAGLRLVMNRHGIDLSKTMFVCARGVVRMMGELWRHSSLFPQPLRYTDVELLEQDLARVRGVVRVHMEFDNWQRQGDGQWKDRKEHRRDESSDADSETAAKEAAGDQGGTAEP